MGGTGMLGEMHHSLSLCESTPSPYTISGKLGAKPPCGVHQNSVPSRCLLLGFAVERQHDLRDPQQRLGNCSTFWGLGVEQAMGGLTLLYGLR